MIRHLRAFVAGLSIAAVICSVGCTRSMNRPASGFARATPSGQDIVNGITETYSGKAFNTSYAGSVVVTLPAVPSNRSWFCNWIMFVKKAGEGEDAPFVQVGVIRWLNPLEYPSAFLTYAKRGGKLTYVDLGRIAEGEHTVSIAGDRATMRLLVDGRVVATYARREFFRSGERPYFQFASEIKVPGDRPSGYLRDLRVKDDTSHALTSIAPACTRYDRGLDLRMAGGRYTPYGTFDLAKPSGFRDCLIGW